MPHAYFEIFLLLLGLSVGSFLNVVIYRLSAGLSLAEPARSFCPHCGGSIAWHDNLPVLSWLLLRGRCRRCAQPISVQYPLVEALTGLAFVLVYRLLAVEHARAGLPGPGVQDIPLHVAWLVLVGGMVACSAMDIFSYSVDIRITNVVTVAGVVLAAAWPRGEWLAAPAEAPLSAACLVIAVVGIGITLWRSRKAPEEAIEPTTVVDSVSAMVGASPEVTTQAPAEAAAGAPLDERAPDVPGSALDSTRLAGPDAGTRHSRTTRLAGLLGTFVMVALSLWMIAKSVAPDLLGGHECRWVVPIALATIFAVITLAGGQRREADDEIRAAVENEQPQARRQVLGELAWLSPAVVVGGAAGIILESSAPAANGWAALVRWSPAGDFVPVAGALYAVRGLVIGAAAGWLLRIFFTLLYGREAFGVGDIYILAAAGATAGTDLVLLGLLLSIGIALASWIIGLVMKASVMIPFGPWLALGFLVALWISRPALRIWDSYAAGIAFAWRERPELLLVAGGLMLVGGAAAVVLARLVRRWIAPE